MSTQEASTPPRTAGDMVRRGREFLARRRPDDAGTARREAELLVAHALGLSRLGLYCDLERPVTAGEVDRARELLVRRGSGVPCAYLTGEREFYGRSFAVGPGVLVPRPETELVVDQARAWVRAHVPADRPARIAELGTGSGCIAITLALELPGAEVRASDVSPTALASARENAARLGAEVTFVEGDGIEPLIASADEPADLFCTNPPYVDPVDETGLDPDVRAHEPAEALFAPEGDPDHWVRRCVEARARLVRPGGALLVELGFDQAARVRAWLKETGVLASGWRVELVRDLEGVERLLQLEHDSPAGRVSP